MNKYISNYQPRFEKRISLYTIDQIPLVGSKIYILFFTPHLHKNVFSFFPYEVNTKETFINRMYYPIASEQKRRIFWTPRKEEIETSGVSIGYFDEKEIKEILLDDDIDFNLYLFCLCNKRILIEWDLDILCLPPPQKDRRDFYYSNKYLSFLSSPFCEDKKIFFINSGTYSDFNTFFKV